MRLMLVGPDGTGKSSLAAALQLSLGQSTSDHKIVWLRFNQYLAKVFNAVCRVTGKSYYVRHSWGKIGYHEYSGKIGTLYIVIVWIDHLLFSVFKRRQALSPENIIVDRYIFDTIVDLFVDTNQIRWPLFLFYPFLKYERSKFAIFCLTCDPEVVGVRRPDVLDDMCYEKKIRGYKIIRRLFRLPRLDTGENSLQHSEQIIMKQVEQCL